MLQQKGLNMQSVFLWQNKVKKLVSIHLSSSRQSACYTAGLDALTSWLMAMVCGLNFSPSPSSPFSVCQLQSAHYEVKLANGANTAMWCSWGRGPHSPPTQMNSNISLHWITWYAQGHVERIDLYVYIYKTASAYGILYFHLCTQTISVTFL